MSPNSLLAGLPLMPPGHILRDTVFPALGKSKVEIANLLGVGRRTLYDLLDGKSPVTTAMALRIGKLTGTEPEVWLRVQQRYDLRRAQEDMAGELDKIPTLEAAE